MTIKEWALGYAKTVYRIPTENWLTVLADTIQQAETGSVIQVDSDAQRELANRAIDRMRRTGQLTVEVHRQC